MTSSPSYASRPTKSALNRRGWVALGCPVAFGVASAIVTRIGEIKRLAMVLLDGTVDGGRKENLPRGR